MQAFYDASRDGWHDYLYGDPAPANALIKRDNPDMTDAIIAQAIDKMKPTAGDGRRRARFRRWRHDRQSAGGTFYQTMQSEGLYPKGLDYTKAYDLRFMRRALQNFR